MMAEKWEMVTEKLNGEIKALAREQVSFDRRITNVDVVVKMLEDEFRKYREEERMMHAQLDGGLKVIKAMIPITAGALSIIVVIVNWLSMKALL